MSTRNCRILRVEVKEDCVPNVVYAEHIGEVFIGVSIKDLESFAGDIVRGELKIDGVRDPLSVPLMDYVDSVVVDYYEHCLSPKYCLICKGVNKGNKIAYLVLNKTTQIEAVSEEEANSLSFLNAVKQDDGEYHFTYDGTVADKLLIPSPMLRFCQIKEEYKRFTKKPYVKGYVQISNNTNRELLSCHIVKIAGKRVPSITIPRFIAGIGRAGLTLHGVTCSLEFTRDCTIRTDSIKSIGESAIDILKMTSQQVESSRLAFLYDGNVTVRKLVLTTLPTEKEFLTLMDIISDLNRYIDLNGFFEEKDIPGSFGIDNILSIECPEVTADYDMTEVLYSYVREEVQWIMEEIEKLLLNCIEPDDFHQTKTEEDEAFKEQLMQYASRLIDENCELITDKFIRLLQPFCKANLTTDDNYSLYKLGDALRDRCQDVYWSVFG